MKLDSVIDALVRKELELAAPLPMRWRRPDRTPRNPLSARPERNWRSYDRIPSSCLTKNRKNWLFVDLRFPAERCGISLRGTKGFLWIGGWCPFTLWLDGRELFREAHAWHATGPIADPVDIPAGDHRLVLCLEPTEIPATFWPLEMAIRPEACIEFSTRLLAAAAQLQMARALATAAAEKRILARAVAHIDLAALADDDWDPLMASISRMEATLSPLSPRAKELTVRLLGHSHIDMDWMWTWPDTVHCIRRDFRAVTDLMDDYPDLTFAISQIPSYDVVRKMDPKVFRKVRHRIAEGRWENVAGTWVEGDLHMADGEAFARHVLYAKDWTRRHLDSEARTLWEPDTFGHPANMPQLARLAGFNAYFHARTNPGGHRPWPVREWRGVDGTTVTAMTRSYNGDLRPTTIVGAALSALEHELRDALHVWGVGDHGGGLSRHQLQLLELFRDAPLMPSIRFGTSQDHLAAVRRAGTQLPSNTGETFSLFEGCWTTHVRLKQYNRSCENALLTAETLATLAGLDRTKTLRDAWTPVLFNQFHDLFDGSSVHDAYDNAYRRAEASLRKARGITRESLGMLCGDGRKTVALLNQLGFCRSEVVATRLPAGTTALRDSDGERIPVQRLGRWSTFVANDIPAFGRKTYAMRQGRQNTADAPRVSVSEKQDYREQNGYFRIETATAVARLCKRSGIIGSYFDKRLGRELIAYGVPKFMGHVPTARLDLAMNLFQVIDESPNEMSAWMIHKIAREENLLNADSVSLEDTGQVFARFRVVHSFRSSRIEEEILFYREVPRVDFEITVHWREKGGPEVGVPQLKVAFAGCQSEPTARFEGPFCITARPADGQEQPTQKWVDVSGQEFGFAILNSGRYGCDVLGSRARVTLLRNAYGPDPETDNGTHGVRLAMVPHPPGMAASELVRLGLSFNRCPVAANGGARRKPAIPQLTVKGSTSVVCTALRRAEHSDRLIIRFFETEGKRSRIRFHPGRDVLSARLVNFLENDVDGACRVRDGCVHASFRPHEVKTFALEL